jgi:hypothetical protein
VTAFFERAHAAIAKIRAVVEAHRETSSEGEPHTKPSSERTKL